MVNNVLAETWFRMSESTPDKELAQDCLKNALRLASERAQSIISERVRERLPEQIRDRDYNGAVESLCSLLKMQGWKHTLIQLQELCKDSVHLQEKVGDVLFHLFGLEFLTGLDIDPLSEFSELQGDSLESLRTEA